VRDDVDRVVVGDAHGRELTLRPVDGFVLHALKTDEKFVSLTISALARDGHVLSSRGIRPRACDPPRYNHC